MNYPNKSRPHFAPPLTIYSPSQPLNQLPNNVRFTVMASPLTPPPSSPPPSLHLLHHHHNNLPIISTANINRRSLLLSSSLSALPSPPTPLDTTITDRVFMDFSICSTYFRPERTLSDTLATLCTDPLPIGRLVIGLYGRVVPLTVSNFKAMCTSSSYKNTLVHKIFPGQFFMAGRQGRRDKGEVRVPLDLARNTEAVESKSFKLTHARPGIVSLCLSENDDEDEIKLDPDYRNVEFLITTGPGPCPQLDNKNIIFGIVLEGLDVVRTIATIPTYKPSERIRQFNDLAEFLGDARAQIARGIWDKPLKTVYISDCGELNVTKPSLSPSLLP